jgi:hypothetical protein
MTRKFEYSFSSVEMTVEVTFSYNTYQNWLDDNHSETFIDDIEIMRVMCGEWDVTASLNESAPAKILHELEFACGEFAVNNN